MTNLRRRVFGVLWFKGFGRWVRMEILLVNEDCMLGFWVIDCLIMGLGFDMVLCSYCFDIVSLWINEINSF
jgi:hypothetical protein